MIPPSNSTPKLETLLLASLYLATHYVRTGCPKLSHKLVQQLEILTNIPSPEPCPMVRETCRRLRELWLQIHAGAERGNSPDDTVMALPPDRHVH